MIHLVLGLVSLINTSLALEEIHDQDVFYNFVLYQNELLVGSNRGIYKIPEGSGELELYDPSVKGPIKSNLSADKSYAIRFIDSPLELTDENLNAVTDFAYHGNNILVIARGKIFVYRKYNYTFSSFESVRSISEHGVGTYGGVYLNNNKLKKIAYTDGQIREFGGVTMVCYNGLLKYEEGAEEIVYLNDNSKRTKGEYGLISDIFALSSSEYLIVSSKGIYEFDENGVFELLYSCQKRVIPIRSKIEDRILQTGEFHFIDNGKYIVIHITSENHEIVNFNVNQGIVDALECDDNGNYFYMISEDDFLLKYVRSDHGLELISQIRLGASAHTMMDFDDLIFLAGNDGLSIYSKEKNQIVPNVIIDEFNRGAIYKSKEQIRIGSIHGIYTFSNLKLFEKELTYADIESSPNGTQSLIIVGFLTLGLITFLTYRRWRNKFVTDDVKISLIKRFIRKNLPVVTLNLIEEEFKLDYNELNSLSKAFSPARYIRQQRRALAKEMFLANNSVTTISEKTGYSETYLVKNKNRFIR